MGITYWQHFFGKKRRWSNIIITLVGLFFYVAITKGAIEEGMHIGSICCYVLNTLFIGGNFILNYINWKS